MPEILVKFGTEVLDTHALAQDVIRLGRSKDNDIVLDHLSVSRHHSEVKLEHGHWIIADLESANGTYVNGQRITTVPLYHADTITIGKHHLHFFDTPVEQQTAMIYDFADEQTMIMNPLTPASRGPRGCLTVTKGKQCGKEFTVDRDRTLIGRSSDCDIRLSDWLVSKHHAQILREDDDFIIEDLGSWRAIQVNGAPVKRAILGNRDEIQIGGTRLSFAHVGTKKNDDSTGPVTSKSKGRGGAKAPSSDKVDKETSRQTTEMEGEDSGYNLAVAAAADMASGHQMTPQTDADHWQGDSTDGAGLDSAPAAEPSFAPSAVETAEPNGSEPEAGEDSPDLAMWLRAYRTGGPATRRHAARQLERLTGKHYEC